VLIRRLSRENVLWSAETIHGHLVLLGFDPPCPDIIRKDMAKTRLRPVKLVIVIVHWKKFSSNRTSSPMTSTRVAIAGR
jgi:hypothetical protein